MKKLIFSKGEIIDICGRYQNSGEKSIVLAEQYRVSCSTILRLLERYNIKRRDHSHSYRKYRINENFFSLINTKEKAYWMGFLYADGYLRKGNKGEIILNLSAKDKGHLEKFKIALKSTHHIKEFVLLGRDYVRFQIGNKKLAEDLKKIFDRGHLPKLSSNLLSHFVRGIFDGDGCIHCSKRDKKIMATLLGRKSLLLEIRDKIPFNCRNKIGKKARRCFQIQFWHLTAIIFLQWIYQNSNKNIRMIRKYDFFIQHKKL